MKGEQVLVVGADGLIGHALAVSWSDKFIWETTRQPNSLAEHRLLLDLSQDISNWQPPGGISVAFICAAVTSLERCRTEPVQSARVNVDNTVALAKKLIVKGTFVIFLSTSLVYNGAAPFRKSEDAVCPNTEYGRQKAEAEKQLLALGEAVSVVRVTKVISPEMSLLKGWFRSLQNNQVIHPFSDMVIAPISLSFTIDVLRRLAEVRLPGTVQISGDKDVTYAQVAQHIAQRIDVDRNLVQPIHSSESGLQLETVPAHTTLDMTRLQVAFGLEPPEVWRTIDTVFGL